MGAAIAVKWSGITALAAAVLLALLWETTDVIAGSSRRRAFARTIRMETLGMVAGVPRGPDRRLHDRRGCRGSTISASTWASWWDNHKAMWDYHQGLTEFAYDSKTNAFTPTHGYYSEAWSWILLRRPVNFYVLDVGDQVRQILTIGNPALFWGSVWALPYAAWSWWRRRDWTAGFVTVGFFGMWLPVVRREPARVPVLRVAVDPFHGAGHRVRLARPGRGPARASRGRRPGRDRS